MIYGVGAIVGNSRRRLCEAANRGLWSRIRADTCIGPRVSVSNSAERVRGARIKAERLSVKLKIAGIGRGADALLSVSIGERAHARIQEKTSRVYNVAQVRCASCGVHRSTGARGCPTTAALRVGVKFEVSGIARFDPGSTKDVDIEHALQPRLHCGPTVLRTERARTGTTLAPRADCTTDRAGTHSDHACTAGTLCSGRLINLYHSADPINHSIGYRIS